MIGLKAADIAEFIKVCSKLFITCWGAWVPEPRLMGHEDKIDRASRRSQGNGALSA